MEYEKGLRVRQDFVIDRKRCDAILQGLDVRKPTRKYASNRTAEIDLRGFNSHHGGFDGACIAFALLYEHESAEQAKKSRIASQVDERDDLDIDVDALADYVFGKYGGEA
ncbi:hypothetical protein C476_00617 [Natrinema limicola JCM 13563]|uniref:Uncharacterized protein n=2 Tax=Natrinema limicola TaxID=370323 RepID=M0CTC0_9EURY|nr:hypothetical protein C476_00617 [Natrinema limicola JCM 13563]